MNRTISPDLSAARAAYIDAWPRVSLRALAEEHGIPYASIRRRAKSEGWKPAAELVHARRRLCSSTENTRRSRAAAIQAAARLLRLARSERTPLDRIYDAARVAHSVTGALYSDVHWLSEDRRLLADLERAQRAA